MAFTHVQSASNTNISTTSLSATITAASPNNLLVVSFRVLTGGGVTGVSVTDNAGTPNTYALAAGPVTVDSLGYVYQYYGVQVTGGATSVTVSWTTTASARLIVDEFSGGKVSNATVFDTTANGSGSAATAAATASLSPAGGGELIVASLCTNGALSAVTAGSGYTLGTTTNASASEYKLSGGLSETAPISWTGSNNWDEIAGAYIAIPASVYFLAVSDSAAAAENMTIVPSMYPLAIADTANTAENTSLQTSALPLAVSDTAVAAESIAFVLEAVLFVQVSDSSVSTENLQRDIPILIVVGPAIQTINGPLVRIA